ncbi:unnamed protein product [Prorocentrum cordatum]|uniref:Uncharacterized protein n=1 Tax=Prorocentrum cordatum TaxID=2364126 RepID=A0ABN9VIF9_9DINO|nr:unnamed protein product [Polarella glacialis]
MQRPDFFRLTLPAEIAKAESSIQHVTSFPLFPFLFVMVMSVIIESTKNKLDEYTLSFLASSVLAILLCADDALLAGRHERLTQKALDAIAAAGKEIGMELH